MVCVCILRYGLFSDLITCARGTGHVPSPGYIGLRCLGVEVRECLLSFPSLDLEDVGGRRISSMSSALSSGA